MPTAEETIALAVDLGSAYFGAHPYTANVYVSPGASTGSGEPVWWEVDVTCSADREALG